MEGKRVKTRKIQRNNPIKQPSKRAHLNRQVSENEDAELLTHQRALQDSTLISSETIFSIQHGYGNLAVQRLLADSKGANQIQRSPTPLGAHVAMRDNEARQRLLQQLLNGAKNIKDYTGGSCYDAAAYIQYLRGLLSFDDLSTTGTDLLRLFDLEAGTLWTGGEIPAGNVVGFKRISGIGLPGSGGFFHVGVGVGGTNIRAVNGGLLGTGWTDVVNLAQNDLLPPQETRGTYLYDRQPIQVWYR